MKKLLKRAAGLVRSIHKDEQGANMVEYVLIIAAVALPILAVLLFYRNDIVNWVNNAWGQVKDVPETPAAPTN